MTIKQPSPGNSKCCGRPVSRFWIQDGYSDPCITDVCSCCNKTCGVFDKSELPNPEQQVYLLWALESGIERLKGIYPSQELADIALGKWRTANARTEPWKVKEGK